MKLTCAIIDDEPLAGQLLESFIKRIDYIEHSSTFTDSVEAIAWVKEHPVDFIFLDIQMPDMDGMEFARLLPDSVKIIFTTAFKEYALESYEVSAVDFLLKPIRFDKVLRACEKVKERLLLERIDAINTNRQKKNKEIYLRSNGEIHKIEPEKIIFVEGMKDYVKFVMDGNKSLVTHATMKNVEELLSSSNFLRISRSHIIALPKIRTIDRNLCVYIGDTVIKVTDQYKKSFEDYLKNHMPLS
ncbi:MAG: response regulator transcription factor [Muribaculaceae bacterium]|nr:response regulator transcription factor [Muribaculaceae bacterium]